MSPAERRGAPPGLRVLAFPRNETNPYQGLLAAELAALGVVVDYLPAETPWQTVNLLLLPWSLLERRARGFRILHLHWTYLFAPPWVRRVAGGRLLMEAWSLLCLLAARALGYRVVWTAHNLVPHGQVFRDDLAARRRFLRLVDTVIAHDEAVVPALDALGARDVRVVREGSYLGHYPDELDRQAARRVLGLDAADRVIVCLGVVAPYKAVDWLLEAVAELPADAPLRVVVAGRCANAALARHLEALAEATGGRAVLHLRYVPDDEVQVYLRAADVAVLPYRRVTNSGSALLAFSFGLPVLVPDLAELAGIPEEIALRYPPSREGLAAGLRRLAELDAASLSAMGERAQAYGESLTWAKTAVATAAVYGELRGGSEFVTTVVGGAAVPDGPGDEVVVGEDVVVVEDVDGGGANQRR